MIAYPLLVALMLSAPEAPPAIKKVAEGSWPYAAHTGADDRQFVIRNATDLVLASPLRSKKLEKEVAEVMVTQAVARALGVKEINWKTHMIVVVHEGPSRNPAQLQFVRGTVSDRTLTVHVLQIIPGKQKGDEAPLVHASRMFLVDRFDGDVKFDVTTKTLK